MIKWLNNLYKLNRFPILGDLFKVRMKTGGVDFDPGKQWDGEKWIESSWKGRKEWLKLMYEHIWIK